MFSAFVYITRRSQSAGIPYTGSYIQLLHTNQYVIRRCYMTISDKNKMLYVILPSFRNNYERSLRLLYWSIVTFAILLLVHFICYVYTIVFCTCYVNLKTLRPMLCTSAKSNEVQAIAPEQYSIFKCFHRLLDTLYI